MTNLDLPRAPDLPTWMQVLKERYLQTETGQFILHGNVHDLILCAGRQWNMSNFLGAFFQPSGKLVVHYDPGQGVWFGDINDACRAAKAWVDAGFIAEDGIAPRGLDNTPDRIIAKNLALKLGAERSPEIVLEALEVLLNARQLPVAAIIHYAELIAPDGPVSGLSFDDRTASARLHRWSISDAIVRGDNVVCMLTGTMADLSRRLTRNPRVGALLVPLPDQETRTALLDQANWTLTDDDKTDVSRVTAGLQLRQVKDLLDKRAANGDSAQGSNRTLIHEINARKKAILEQECFGLVEVLEPKYGFEVVGGNEPIKAALSRVADHVRTGRRTQVPMGILCVGPMGTGKTFVTKAFAKESGLAAIQLKNFRDKWVGSTEANLEKVLNVIEALGQILVIIDEGDRSLGGGDSDGGVSSRVMARLKEFMSDTSHRGRIIFVMMTNRPDKLDTDMKRPGRFDLKIPFFPPQSAGERWAILQALARRYEIQLQGTDDEFTAILEPLKGYAAADLEAVLLLAFDHRLPIDQGMDTKEVSTTLFGQAVDDFMPTREIAMIEYMELLAVFEASNRRLLPPQFKDIDVSDLNRRIADIRERIAREKLVV